MNALEVKSRFGSVAVWSRAHQRAPHKPLLILIALARIQQGDRSPILFADIETNLTNLLNEFGPPRLSFHPEYPFWRLQSDGIWRVESDRPMKPRASNNDVLKSELIAHHARGEFTSEVKAAFEADPSLITEVAFLLLEQHFPESLHPDILSAVGLSLAVTGPRGRDPTFRHRVLTAYEYRCAVCGFDVRLGSVSIALDAAHIRWHQAGGPPDESNGLALCVLHHKTFDLGAFTVSESGTILVSDQVHGSEGFDASLMRHHTKRVRRPQRPEWHPASSHLSWHSREVFKGAARHHATILS
jgi:putative restriction endonuclease